MEPQGTVYRPAWRLTDLGVATPMDMPRWNVASVRGILRNLAYAGRALTNRTKVVQSRRRGDSTTCALSGDARPGAAP